MKLCNLVGYFECKNEYNKNNWQPWWSPAFIHKLIPNSSQNCTKLARLPLDRAKQKEEKQRNWKEEVLNFFAKSLPSGQTQQHRKKNKEFKKPRQGEKPVTPNLCKEWPGLKILGKPFQELNFFQTNLATSVLQTNLGKRKLGNFKRWNCRFIKLI